MTAVATALAPPNDLPAQVRVQVHFGSHLISDWVGPADRGQRLAVQQQRRFTRNCTITCEPIDQADVE